MDIARIKAILVDSLGDVDQDQQPLEGSQLFNFFVTQFALKTDKVHEHAAEMIELLKEWPMESWGQPAPMLGEEISYIAAGAVLDDQTTALMLFAFGTVVDWWDIIDPHTALGLKYDDPQGLAIARRGMVMITGYRPSDSA